MRKNKVLCAAMASAMSLSLLAGCGGNSASTAASASAAAGSSDTTAAADADTEEGKVLNIWCWNDEFQSRFNDYYPGVKEVAADKSTTTLNNGITVKWTINPTTDNNYQNKLDEALLKQDSAAADDKIDIFLVEADYALKYVDSDYTLDVKNDVGLTDDDLKDQYQYTRTSFRWTASRKAPAGRQPPVCLRTAAVLPRMCWARMTPPRCRAL